jgi:hypothetical protein
MDRRTYRLPADILVEVAAAAERCGVSQNEYVRLALARQLGRETCRDEIAALRELADQRHRELAEEIAALKLWRRHVGR